MGGRQTRNNCPFCQHPDRDELELAIRVGKVSVDALDKENGWASGASHRHMRRHSGNYHNNSNHDCPICTHPERAEIESSILEGRAGIEEFSYELNIEESVVSHHMEKHTKPIIMKQAEIEVLPSALKSTHDSLVRIETNMNRLDRIFGLQLERVEEQFYDEMGIVNPKDLELAVRMHREVRETLSELAKWMDRVEVIDQNQNMSVVTVIQAHFAEKSPDEWGAIRKALAEAGVLDE
jgi:hypothetical protein